MLQFEACCACITFSGGLNLLITHVCKSLEYSDVIAIQVTGLSFHSSAV